jgi:RimJ/RimL family protein N-acetyltransferase
MTTQELPPQGERIEIEGTDGLAVRQLMSDDDQAYFEALHHDPARFQHGEEKTLKKYPTVGSVNLQFNRPKSAELGYWSGFKGHHYSERAAQLLIPYAFSNYDIDKLTAWAAAGNEGSRKILGRLGFVQVTNGQDQVMYELPRDINRLTP